MKKILRLALIAVLCAFGVACAMAVDLSSKQKTFINNTQTVNNDLKGDKMKSQIKNFLQNCEQIIKSQVKQYENRSPFATKIPPVSILPYDEFEKKYGSNLYLDSSCDVLVFDGDLSLSGGTINSAWLKDKFNRAGGKNNARTMFVTGKLSIGDDIVDDD